MLKSTKFLMQSFAQIIPFSTRIPIGLIGLMGLINTNTERCPKRGASLTTALKI